MFGLENLKSGGTSKSAGKEEDIKNVLEVLSTSIEAINQRLSGTNMDDSFNATMKEFLPWVSKSLQLMDQEIKQIQKKVSDLNNAIYKIEENVETSIKNISGAIDRQSNAVRIATQKIDTTQAMTTRTITESNEAFGKSVKTAMRNLENTQSNTTKIITQSNDVLNKNLAQMIEIHMEEIKLLRQQNKLFVEKMESMQKSIMELIENNK